MIITIISPIRHIEQCMKIYRNYSVLGDIVLIPVDLNGEFSERFCKEGLKLLHKEKIKMCDKVIVNNYNNYLGEDTIEEIEYAKSINKEIEYYHH